MNKKIKTSISLATFPLLTLLIIPAHAAGTFSLTSGVDYSTGKYGQAESTDITYIPFTGKYENDDYSLKLTIPWLQITGPGDVVGGNAPIVLGKSNRPVTTQSGLGDMVFSATHSIAKLGENNPLFLDLTGKVKFATASSSKNLGTGKNDYSVTLDAFKSLNNSVTLFGDIGYKVIGDPSGINLNNVWFGTAGLSYKLNPTTNTGFMLDTRQATQNNSAAMRELTVFLTHKFNASYKLQSYLTHGYSDASTDWSGGLMLARTF